MRHGRKKIFEENIIITVYLVDVCLRGNAVERRQVYRRLQKKNAVFKHSRGPLFCFQDRTSYTRKCRSVTVAVTGVDETELYYCFKTESDG